MVIRRVPKPKKVNINKNNVSDKERVLELARKDIISFGQLFLPDDFMKSTPAAYHYELNNLLSHILAYSPSKNIPMLLPTFQPKFTPAE